MELIGQTKPNLWVFTDWSPLHDYSDVYWRECFLDEDFNHYNIRIIDGQYLNHESFLLGDVSFKNSQLKFLIELLNKHEIKDGDVFVFANAWNFIAVPLTFIKYEFNLDIKMIGFWGNSLFNRTSPMFKRLKLKNEFGHNFEATLFKSYDLNCFLCEEHLHLFKKRHTTGNFETAKITGFPFEYLSKKVKLEEKQDIIFTPYPIQDEIQSRVWKGIQSDHTEYLYVNSFITHRNRDKYKELVKASKFMYNTREFEHDPTLVYEAMLNGVVPFIQNRYLYQIVFPEEYLIPKLDINKRNRFLYMMRHRIIFSDFFATKIEKYDYWQNKVKEDAKIIGEKYYSNQKFINELKQITE